MLSVPYRNLVARSSLERDIVKLATISTNSVKMTRMTTNTDDPRTSELIRLGRCCKGARARIKSLWLPWEDAIAAC
uniref:Uncharacterized protein n=1 Tax=Arundo donax TaxID=35708 RepID=A0A0A9DMH5_ARUDO